MLNQMKINWNAKYNDLRKIILNEEYNDPHDDCSRIIDFHLCQIYIWLEDSSIMI